MLTAAFAWSATDYILEKAYLNWARYLARSPRVLDY